MAANPVAPQDGWSVGISSYRAPDMTDDEILLRLLVLNHARAAQQGGYRNIKRNEQL